MKERMKPKLMLEQLPKFTIEPAVEEGDDVEFDVEEEEIQSPLLEMKISRCDYSFTVRIVGEKIDKAKNIALELFEKTITKK